MRENSKQIFREGRGEGRGKRKMDKGKLGRMMRRGKYEVLRAKWTEEKEEEKFQLLPAPPSSEAPPRPPLMGGGGRLRRFAMGLIEMIRTAAASIAGRPDIIPADIIGPANSRSRMPRKMTTMTSMRPSVWLVPAGRTAATVAGTTTHLCLKFKEKYKK